MITRMFRTNLLLAIVFIALFGTVVFGQDARDLVSGNLIQFNDNGAWCWYQDERAVVDMAGGKLIVGSDASGSGVRGSTRNGVLDAVIFDLKSGLSRRYALWQAGCDDHNTPGFLVRPDGKYLAMYAEHYDKYNSRYRIFDGGAWTPEQRFDWTTIPGGTDYTIAYSNLYYLSSEGRVYDFARANHRAPNFIVSNDMGDTWSFGGQLTTNMSDTYNKGYYKYWGNGVDRIDFIFTEQHPRDTTTSIYHGYIKDGKTYASDGTIVDNDIYDISYMPTFRQFTKVFTDSTVINGVAMRRCWNTDVVRYDDGTIVTIVTARTNNYQGGGSSSINPDHAFIYCRYDGSEWSYTYLGKAGLKMYASEQDYTGLGAVCPNDPNTIYISTTFDPRDDSSLGVHEIFKGVTADNGATWSWTPITQKSVRDNFRPIVPSWDTNNTALLWWRGTYYSAQRFDAAVVGLVERSSEPIKQMSYLDATLSNTMLATGATLVTTGPDANQGASDSQWHERTGIGNGGSILTSAEVGGENAPLLKTQVTLPQKGTYDVWINFWGKPTADWRIKAGLSESNMQIFRQMACKQVVSGDHDTPLVLTGSDNSFLYQAYLGRVIVSTSYTFEVFVDDESIQTGSSSNRVGNTCRTWYDGISYALIQAEAELPIFTQTDTTNLGITTTVGMFGTAWGDYDGDGDMDLFQPGVGNPSILYRNDGGTQFVNVSATGVLVDSTGGSAEGPVWADFNNDGDLDLLSIDGGVKLYRNDGTVFTDISVASGLSIIDPGVPLWAPAVGDYDKDGDLDIALAGTDQGAGGAALPTRILNNDGTGVFTNVAEAVIGFDLILESWNPAWVDVDNDGDLDLFMPTIRTPNEGCALLLNDNGELLITDRTQTGLTAKSAIYSAWADYNNDGYMDLYLVPFSGDADGGAKLFKNNGNGTFENVAPALGIDSTYSNCRAIAWGDYNNDGWIDLLVTQRNGLIQHLWRNEGGTFARELDAGLPNGTQIRHAQFVDYDNDGFLDLYLGNMSAVKYLMHNNGNSNHWLGIKPVGVTTNTAGIGARIRVVAGTLVQIRDIQGGGGGGLSNGYLWGQFGLGAATVADSVIVKWSNGVIEVAVNVPADKYYTFKEGVGITGVNDKPGKTTPKDYVLYQNYPNPFNPTTTIVYSVPKESHVTLKVFNMLGEEIVTLVNHKITAGTHRINWNTQDLPAGIYFCKITADTYSKVNKMMLLR